MQVIEQLKKTPSDRFLAIYSSLQQHGFGPLDNEVAKALRFRPQAIKKVPLEQRAKRAKMLLESSGNAELAYDLFGAYLMKHCKGLITGFLDATGVKHEDGMIADLDQNKPAAAKLKATVEKLDQEFDPLDVTLYLAICAEQWSSVPEIEKLWRSR